MGLVATGVFSLSPLAWMWSVTAEVFGLNNLMVAALMLVAVLFDQASDETERLKVSTGTEAAYCLVTIRETDTN